MVTDFLAAKELRPLDLHEDDFGPAQGNRPALSRQGNQERLGQLVGGAVHQRSALVGDVVLRHPFPLQQLVHDLERVGHKRLPAVQDIRGDHDIAATADAVQRALARHSSQQLAGVAARDRCQGLDALNIEHVDALTQGGEVHRLFEMTQLDLIGHGSSLSICIVLLS